MRRLLPCVFGLLTLSAGWTVADDPALPGAGWAASRYEALWSKSPFAVATPEAAPESSDYTLLGIAQFDGVSYASLVDKQSNEHFLLASDKPTRDLTLVSITRGTDSSGTTAVVQKDGQPITLKMEQGPSSSPGGPPPINTMAPAGNGNPQSNPGNDLPPPPVRMRPHIIRVPPMPATGQQIQPPPPPP